MPKGLCIGYSVTEGRGFIEKINDRAQCENYPLSIERSGWGGHSIETIAYMIDVILAHHTCDFVILEIATTGRHLTPESFSFYLDQVLRELAVANLPIIFLSLLDRNVNYNTDFLSATLRSYSKDYGIPSIDVISKMLRMKNDEIDVLFGDNVHTNNEGAVFYTNIIYKELLSLPASRRYIRYFASKTRFLHNIPVIDLVCCDQTFQIARHGTPLIFAEIAEDQSLHIPLSRPISLQAIVASFGPRSGRLHLSSSSTSQTLDLMPHDTFCYYERSGFLPSPLTIEKELVVFQSSDLPAITLRKGEPNLGARIGRISHLMYREVSEQQPIKCSKAGPRNWRERFRVARQALVRRAKVFSSGREK